MKGVFEVPLPWCRVSSGVLTRLLYDAPPKADVVGCFRIRLRPWIWHVLPHAHRRARLGMLEARKIALIAGSVLQAKAIEKPCATTTLPARPLLKDRQCFLREAHDSSSGARHSETNPACRFVHDNWYQLVRNVWEGRRRKQNCTATTTTTGFY